MNLTPEKKSTMKKALADCLAKAPEVMRVVVFGSFVKEDSVNDIDVAVFQSSSESYLPLAMKYRKMVRAIAREISVDIFPVRTGPQEGSFLKEINQGEVVYER